MKKILILGGGFAGVYAFTGLHKRFHKDPEVQIGIISREDYFLFTPLLHEAATGGIGLDSVKFGIRSMLRCCLYDFVQASVLHIDLEKRIVSTTSGQHSYDILVYALGAGTSYFSLSDESQKHVVPLKEACDARRVKERLVDLFEDNTPDPHVVVIGGGPTGVELVAEINEYFDTLRKLFRRRDGRVTLMHGGERLLPQFHAELGRKTKTILAGRGVRVILNAQAAKADACGVTFSDGRMVPAQLIIWTAGVVANRVPMSPEPAADEKGRIVVLPTLQMPQHQEVFIIGDSAGVPNVPMTAQSAVAMAAHAAKNIIAFADGKKLKPFAYHHRGDLFSLGQWLAGAEIFGVRFFGHFAWWLWRTIYLFKMIGLRNKVKVAADWTLNLFLPRDISV